MDKLDQKILILSKKINIKFKNLNLYKEALTHKSANLDSNSERLEFLGDRVIGLVISKKLLALYPKESEGILDKKFSNLVDRKTCSDVAWKINLNKFIILGDPKKVLKQSDKKILSDSIESLVGAIFLENGFFFVEKFILGVWKNHLKQSNFLEVDPKTKLQEYSLKCYKKLPIYKLENYKGPNHNPTFKISVKIHKTKKFIGTSNSKKNAQQLAAKSLLKYIRLSGNL